MSKNQFVQRPVTTVSASAVNNAKNVTLLHSTDARDRAQESFIQIGGEDFENLVVSG